MRRKALIIVIFILILDIVLGIWIYSRWRGEKFAVEIRDASKRYGVDPKLIRSLVWQESRFDPTARGAAGEIGLMQIMEIPAEDWAVAEDIETWSHEMCVDPATNLLAGTWYLSKMIKRYPNTDDPLAYALADYNAGRTHVLRWAKGSAETNSLDFIEAITFPTTKKYVRTILKKYREE